MSMRGGWVIEVDIQSFFEDLDHGRLREFLGQRVRDGVVTRLVGKWLKAGVMEQGQVERRPCGTPQGGVISPLLANIYLHEVFDKWFDREVRPRLGGRSFAVRYADDIVMVVPTERDARRVMAALPKRFGRYGLHLHPAKTRVVQFRRPRPGESRGERGGASFDFLGFTHYWGQSRRGAWVVKQQTAKDRFRRALRDVGCWCRIHRHRAVKEQHEQLCRKLRGHYGYYGITGNFRALARYFHLARRAWRKWLDRRSQRARMSWDKFERLIQRYPLPPPRVVHSSLAANP
jgi:group II intron reverse transcriptase/maturase